MSGNAALFALIANNCDQSGAKEVAVLWQEGCHTAEIVLLRYV
tara:strand:- start:240 stop:368 length:129 start_codon:yes stop_codon:yes gene_type:complete